MKKNKKKELFFDSFISKYSYSKEKDKLKNIKKSNWWKNKIADGICYYCKKQFKPKDLTIDHVIPISRGGKSSKNNIVPCCKECNNKKKCYIPVELKIEELNNL